jgi:hypothetical protein
MRFIFILGDKTPFPSFMQSTPSLKLRYRQILEIKTPTPGNNTFIYALNPIAEEALHIALNDTKVKQIINEQKGKAITIAAIQPTSVLQSKDKKVSYSASGPGQIIITSNWQYVDGNFYSNTANFNELDNKHTSAYMECICRSG